MASPRRMPPPMPAPPGEPYTSPPLGEWFLVRVLTVIAGTPQTYTFEEWQLGGDGTWDTKTGGRVATEDNAGYTLPAADDSEQTLAVDDFAWARAAFGAGGLVWEMVPMAGGGGDPDAVDTDPDYAATLFTTANTFYYVNDLVLPTAGDWRITAQAIVQYVRIAPEVKGDVFVFLYDYTHNTIFTDQFLAVSGLISDFQIVNVTFTGSIRITEPTHIQIGGYRTAGNVNTGFSFTGASIDTSYVSNLVAHKVTWLS